MEGFLTAWLGAVPVYMTPLLLAATGLILCERVGILNLGSEGMMAFGAVAGAVTVLSGGAPWLGLAAGLAAGVALAVPFWLAVVVFRANHILAGLGVVAIGLGAAATLGRDHAHKPFAGLGKLDLAPLDAIPLVGPFLFRQDAIAYLAVAIALAASVVLSRSMTGLRLRAIGEDPATADTAGIDVPATQIAVVTIGCALVGLAGAYLSVVGSKVYVDGMVAGRGWVAIALVVFARWSPARAILGALIFGAAEALIPRLQVVGAEVPVYILSMLPYVVTILALVAVAILDPARQGEPRFLGRAYLRQDR
ncbi:MAG: ABC transporter permease [Azospirillaceae bacterium]